MEVCRAATVACSGAAVDRAGVSTWPHLQRATATDDATGARTRRTSHTQKAGVSHRSWSRSAPPWPSPPLLAYVCDLEHVESTRKSTDDEKQPPRTPAPRATGATGIVSRQPMSHIGRHADVQLTHTLAHKQHECYRRHIHSAERSDLSAVQSYSNRLEQITELHDTQESSAGLSPASAQWSTGQGNTRTADSPVYLRDDLSAMRYLHFPSSAEDTWGRPASRDARADAANKGHAHAMCTPDCAAVRVFRLLLFSVFAVLLRCFARAILRCARLSSERLLNQSVTLAAVSRPTLASPIHWPLTFAFVGQ